MECIFCKIVEGQLPSNKVYEDEEFLVFHDINPVAPVHLLIIPKRHIPSVADLSAQDTSLVGRMMLLTRRLATEQGLDESGYRILTNHGRDGGQIVDHLHFHLLGGRKLGPIA